LHAINSNDVSYWQLVQIGKSIWHTPKHIWNAAVDQVSQKCVCDFLGFRSRKLQYSYCFLSSGQVVSKDISGSVVQIFPVSADCAVT
jgi:hypothetical protein